MSPTYTSFPTAKIEERLRAWWRRKSESPLRQRTHDPRIKGGTVFDIQPEVSSTEAVEVFLEVEHLLGFKLKSSGLIKPGGYRTCDEFVQNFLPRLQAKYVEANSVPPTASRTPAQGTQAHAS